MVMKKRFWILVYCFKAGIPWRGIKFLFLDQELRDTYEDSLESLCIYLGTARARLGSNLFYLRAWEAWIRKKELFPTSERVIEFISKVLYIMRAECSWDILDRKTTRSIWEDSAAFLSIGRLRLLDSYLKEEEG